VTDFFEDLSQPLSPQEDSRSLQPRALCDALADRVRERILSHELAPGTAIDEVALLKDYSVSRTPVREALKLLQHEGLLTGRPRRGMFVTVLSPQEVREALALHSMLSRYAANGQGHAPGPDTLLSRMLEMAERQLRLAYGPSFREKMRCEASDLDQERRAAASGAVGWRASSTKALT